MFMYRPFTCINSPKQINAMKTQTTDISQSQYPKDFKEVYKAYLLRKEVIETYNKKESQRLKSKKIKHILDV
jgi:hypothetical protein